MENMPVYDKEPEHSREDAIVDGAENEGDELRNERNLAIKTGHIAVNPLADDNNFSAVDDDGDGE